MNIKLLTEHHLEFLSLKGGCTGSSESIYVKIQHCLEITCHASYSFWTDTLDGALKASVSSGDSSVYMAREGVLDLKTDTGKSMHHT